MPLFQSENDAGGMAMEYGIAVALPRRRREVELAPGRNARL